MKTGGRERLRQSNRRRTVQLYTVCGQKQTDRQIDRKKRKSEKDREGGRVISISRKWMWVLADSEKKEQNQENNKPAASAVLIKS